MESILEKFRRDAARDPGRKLYSFLDCGTEPFGQEVVTTGEAWRRAADLAAELRARGAKKGDRAIILSMQDAGTVYAVWGCMLAGVVFTVIPPPIDEGKLSRFVSVLRSCKPRFLISNEGMEKTSDQNVTGPLLRRAFLNVVSLRRIYTDKIPAAKGPAKVCPHGPKDLCYLQYTSGSTSAPKGVMVTYGNLMGCIGQCLEMFDFQHTSNNLASWVPFYHNIGLIVAIFLPVIANTGISYFIPTLQFLAKPTVWLQVLSRFKVNITAAPNSAYEVCARLVSPEAAKEYDLSHVTHLINGSEFVNAATVEKFCRLFGISENAFAPGYGLSECVCVATLASMDYHRMDIRVEDYRQNRFVPAPRGEAGTKAIVGVGATAGDMKIVAIRPDGTPCGPGEIGEICLQSGSVCAGYWQNPEETKRFQTVIPGHPGFFYRTGDMGVMQEGQLYLTGRIKEMIIISGKNIFPSDITLLFHEQGVALPMDAMTVFSVASGEGERPVLAAEAPADADFRAISGELNRLTSQNFDFSFADIVFVREGTLPRTDNRKIKTLAAKAQYEDGRLSVLYSTSGQGQALSEAPAPRLKVSLPQNATPEQVEPVIREIFRSLLPGSDFGPNDSFLELGGDSLRMMELVCGMEQDLGVPIDLRQVAAAPTVAGISAYLSDLLRGGGSAAATDLRAECLLPEDIRPKNGYLHTPEQCRNILLTGATGFLGAYLIRSLLRQRGKGGLKIYCHARAADREAAMERIVANMKRFACWKESYRDYITPVPGDLNLPRLGMSPEDWKRLAQRADMVIHNGAVLNFVYPYRQLKQTNVTGTAECLRFACEGRAKYFHYISSYSVYDNPSHFDREVLESDPLESPDGYFLGYSETKWVAEKLVGIARERGLRAAVYRPGDITGTLKDGIWKLEDLISRSLVGCIQLGCLPDVRVNLHLTPVDFVADAIVAIAFQSASSGGDYNLINHDILPVEKIAALMERAGWPLQVVPYDQWCRRLTACTAEENVLRILSCLFTDQRLAGESLIERFGERQARFSTAQADALLQQNGIRCPPVNAALMRSYLRHFAASGYLPRPKGVRGVLWRGERK